MSFYLDTSVLVPLQVPEPRSGLLQDWLRATTEPLSISDLAVAEFHSALSRHKRMGPLPAEAIAAARSNFERWKLSAAEQVENLPIDVRLAASLVQHVHPKLVAPDAIHIATCRRLGLTLVAHDEDMIIHAQRAGVSCVAP